MADVAHPAKLASTNMDDEDLRDSRVSALEPSVPPWPRPGERPHDRGAERPGVRRAKTNDITTEQARVLQAWQALRRDNPWQQPSVTELARAVGIPPAQLHQHVLALVRAGILVRLRGKGVSVRPYALAPEACARPHMQALVRIATDVVSIDPSALDSASTVERAEALATFNRVWLSARATVAQLVSLHGALRSYSAEEERGDSGPPA